MSQPERYYDQVQAIILRIMGKLSWNDLCTELYNVDIPFSDQELTSKECGVGYIRGTMENRAWTTSLALISWVLRNFQKKMEDGHCHNITHPHGETIPRNCELGRAFHREMFNKCLQSYIDILKTFQNSPASPQGTQDTTHPPH
jgi:hypothetical protein